MMKVLEKIIAKQNDNKNQPGVTVCFLGDSVTQGCFELYNEAPQKIQTVFDKKSAYHKYFADIFSVLCPSVPINIINSGISGATAPHSLGMIDELVLKHNPDLVVVCFGLNDSSYGIDKISDYTEALSAIFKKIRAIGSEIIFMTPNMVCDRLSGHLTEDNIISVAKRWVEYGKAGFLDKYIDAARELCKSENIIVCDCYKKWKRMSECGLNVTELLSNKINHPTRDMNWLFAYSLVETIFNAD